MTALWGSRKKAKLALRRTPPATRQDDNNTALSIVALANEDERAKPTSPGGSGGGSPRNCASKRSITRFGSCQVLTHTPHKDFYLLS